MKLDGTTRTAWRICASSLGDWRDLRSFGGVCAARLVTASPERNAVICGRAWLHYDDPVRLVAKEPGSNPGRFRHCEGRATVSDRDL
jgi:hypothetical protein